MEALRRLDFIGLAFAHSRKSQAKKSGQIQAGLPLNGTGADNLCHPPRGSPNASRLQRNEKSRLPQ